MVDVASLPPLIVLERLHFDCFPFEPFITRWLIWNQRHGFSSQSIPAAFDKAYLVNVFGTYVVIDGAVAQESSI